MIGEMNSKPIIKEGLYYGMVTYGINEQRELKTKRKCLLRQENF